MRALPKVGEEKTAAVKTSSRQQTSAFCAHSQPHLALAWLCINRAQGLD